MDYTDDFSLYILSFVLFYPHLLHFSHPKCTAGCCTCAHGQRCVGVGSVKGGGKFVHRLLYMRKRKDNLPILPILHAGFRQIGRIGRLKSAYHNIWCLQRSERNGSFNEKTVAVASTQEAEPSHSKHIPKGSLNAMLREPFYLKSALLAITLFWKPPL